MEIIYHLLDWFFTVFHISLILFNLFGWIWKRSRKLNLITLLLTAVSWFILGLFFTIGYCPFTDWHFRILNKMGIWDLPASYIDYLVQRLTGYEISSSLADTAAVSGLAISFFFSLFMNIRDLTEQKRKRKTNLFEKV